MVVAYQLIGRVSEHTSEKSIVGILNRLLELHPQKALPRLGRGVLFVPPIRRQSNSGRCYFRYLRRWVCYRQSEFQQFITIGLCCMTGLELSLDRVAHLDRVRKTWLVVIT